MQSNQHDKLLIQAARLGDPRASEQLIQRYFGMVYSLAYARVRHHEQAEDLAQEVFLRVYLHLDHYDSSISFAAWISRITRNLAIDWWRRGRKKSSLSANVSYDEIAEFVTDDHTDNAADKLAYNETVTLIHQAIHTLPALQREIVMLHYHENLNNREIADRLEVHPTTVGRQMDKAMQVLRKKIEPEFEAQPATEQPRQKRVMARSLALLAGVSAMKAGARNALAGQAGVQTFSAPVSYGFIPGPFLTKIGMIIKWPYLTLAKLFAPLSGAAGFAKPVFNLVIVIGFIIALAYILTNSPSPTGNPTAQTVAPIAAKEDALISSQQEEPKLSRFTGSEPFPSEGPAATALTTNHRPASQRDFEAVADKHKCRILNLETQNLYADVTVEANARKALVSFLEGCKQEGWLSTYYTIEPMTISQSGTDSWYRTTYRIHY